MLKKITLLAVALAVVSSAIGAAPAPEVADAELLSMLERGVTTSQRGNPEAAIRESFDPVLKALEARYRKEKRRIYSANSQVEAVYYLGLAAVEKRGAVVLDGLWSTALYQKAWALIEAERFRDAEKVLERLLELSPRHPVAWSELGAVHQAARDWKAAMHDYREAEISAEFLKPMEGEDGADYRRLMTRAWRGQGFVLIETGKLDEAESLYHRCLELDPEDKGAKQELAYIANLRSKSP